MVMEAADDLSAVIKAIPIFVFILVVTTLLLWMIRSHHSNVPVLLGYPIIGNAGLLKKVFHDASALRLKAIAIIMQMMNGLVHVFMTTNESKVVGFRIMNQEYVILAHPDAVEAVLGSNEILQKSADYTFFHSWLGTGLLTSHGNKWRTRRKMLTPTFHYRILEDFIPVFNEQAAVLVEKLRDEVMTKGQKVMNIEPFVTHCTLDIICETALGIKIGAQRNSNSLYVQSLKNVADCLICRMFKPWLWNDFIFKLTSTGKKYYEGVNVLHDFTKKAIKTRKAEMTKKTEEKPHRRLAFLDLLLHYHLDDPENFGEDDIREEVDTFTFEGHDTTAAGICWALYLVGLYPEVQKKIQDELDEVCGERPDITIEKMKNLKYLECVIKESQRLYPSVPFIARENHQDIEVCGNRIAKATHCIVLTYQLHRNADVFANPEQFDPERFSLEKSSGRHPYSYIPFSAGPRNCIGQRFALMEEKTVLSYVLQHFEVTSVDPRDKVIVVPELISRSSLGFRLQLKQRTT